MNEPDLPGINCAHLLDVLNNTIARLTFYLIIKADSTLLIKYI